MRAVLRAGEVRLIGRVPVNHPPPTLLRVTLANTQARGCSLSTFLFLYISISLYLVSLVPATTIHSKSN